MPAQSPLILAALGANLPWGDTAPAQTLLLAVRALADEGFEIVQTSRFFRTPCFPAGAGPDYVNAAIALRSKEFLEPNRILCVFHEVEHIFGRERIRRWGMRTLDLDLLAVGQMVLPDSETQARWRLLPIAEQPNTAPDQLILPHPRLQDRAFVLVPLADIAPDWRHPVTGSTVADMLEALPQANRLAVVPLPL